MTASDLLADLPPALIDDLARAWAFWARDDQWPPYGAWTTWLVLGGRGAGKTRTGAEWVRGMALGEAPFTVAPIGRIALIGETQADARDVMVEGESGLLALHRRSERPVWHKSLRRLTWPNGAVAQIFSAEDPEALRGPQFGAAWLDELAKWKKAEETWDMLQFGLRLGDAPRQVVTTTPRATSLLKRLLADPLTSISRAKTQANAYNLAPSFLDRIVGRYKGTRLGRQELDGELIEDRDDALWSRTQIESLRCSSRAIPALNRIVVAVDPPASSSRSADRCGIVIAGIAENGSVYILEDATLAAATPARWAQKAVSVFHKHQADAIIVEVNQGGEMVEAVLRTADASVPIRPVRATRGKFLRAEPVAHLYERGRVFHAGHFESLEDEMCDFGPGPKGFALSHGGSPDRLDALVWAVTALALTPHNAPKLRRL